ncbi:MAG: hypothetical protein JST17_04150 [Bacteroidetes bacterium]|nr:hypothetical protein [Bacteroidota bacterium]MBS1929601.1 hypothetical protein [Bacteroidota bacterium]
MRNLLFIVSVCLVLLSCGIKKPGESISDNTDTSGTKMQIENSQYEFADVNFTDFHFDGKGKLNRTIQYI